MPASYVHICSASNAVLKWAPENEKLHLNAVQAGSEGPDPLFYSFIPKKGGTNLPAVANAMHKTKTGAFLKSLVGNAGTSTLLKSFVYGFLSHYATDTVMHPYIYTKSFEENGDYNGNKHCKYEHAMEVYVYRRSGNMRGLPVQLAGFAALKPAEKVQIAALLEKCIGEVYPELAPTKEEIKKICDPDLGQQNCFQEMMVEMNMGTINPDAAAEYEALKARYDYLHAQVADIEAARRSLAKVARAIDGRMRDDFANTFKAVDENFQRIFAQLFPGGSASLSLVEGDDPENAGIEVNAQPRGKRITKLSLMSGGEKSLTALALLFAVYATRPTPFYILDEVEAALDDTNLRRLCAYLDDMRMRTQLIMITHQRRTMEMADVLYGISMQQDGVTKVLSQKLDRTRTSQQ